MFLKRIKGAKVLILSLLYIFSLLFVLANVYAQEPVTDVEEDSIKEAEKESLANDRSYRQALKKVVEVREEDLAQEVDSYVRYIPSSKVGSQSGKVSIVDSAAEYSYVVKAFGKLPIEFAVGTEYVGINNSTAIKLPAHLTTFSFGAETTVPFFNFDKTYFTIGLAPTWSTSNWNFESSSFRMPQRYFFIYQPNDKWTFICGVGVFPDYKSNVLPIAGFIYKPNDRWTFNIIPKRPEISYAINQKWTVFGEGGFTSDEYEVTREQFKNVILEYNEMHVGGGLRYTLNKHIKGSISVGRMFNRSLVYDPDSLGKVSMKDNVYTEFRTDIVF